MPGHYCSSVILFHPFIKLRFNVLLSISRSLCVSSLTFQTENETGTVEQSPFHCDFPFNYGGALTPELNNHILVLTDCNSMLKMQLN